MSLNSNFYYVLGLFFVKHMIWRRDSFTYKYLLYSHLFGNSRRQTTSGPSTKPGPWICLVYLHKLSQHLKFRRLMQKSAVQASPKAKSDPLAHPTLWSACRATPLIWGMCSWVYWPHLAFSLTQFTSFSSISIWVSKFCFIVYFDKYFKVLKTILSSHWFHILKGSLKNGIEFFKLEFLSWLWWFLTE